MPSILLAGYSTGKENFRTPANTGNLLSVISQHTVGITATWQRSVMTAQFIGGVRALFTVHSRS